MNKQTRIMLTTVTWLLIAYLICSFYAVTFDISKWSSHTRMACCLCFGVISVVSMIAFYQD